MTKPDRPPTLAYRSPGADGKKTPATMRNQIGAAAIDSGCFVIRMFAAWLYKLSRWIG